MLEDIVRESKKKALHSLIDPASDGDALIDNPPKDDALSSCRPRFLIPKMPVQAQRHYTYATIVKVVRGMSSKCKILFELVLL